jgi:hypothetical protein
MFHSLTVFKDRLPTLGLTSLRSNPTVSKALRCGFVPTTCFGVVHPPSRRLNPPAVKAIALCRPTHPSSSHNAHLETTVSARRREP